MLTKFLKHVMALAVLELHEKQMVGLTRDNQYDSFFK